MTSSSVSIGSCALLKVEEFIILSCMHLLGFSFISVQVYTVGPVFKMEKEESWRDSEEYKLHESCGFDCWTKAFAEGSGGQVGGENEEKALEYAEDPLPCEVFEQIFAELLVEEGEVEESSEDDTDEMESDTTLLTSFPSTNSSHND